MNTALIFPGQGSQYVGMGKSLAENFSESREIYERVDEALNEIIRFSTVPGTSRHHWGTEIDIIDEDFKNENNPLISEKYETGGVFNKLKKWMDSNSEKFGFYAIFYVAILVIVGLVFSYILVGNINALFSTIYGNILLLKFILVSILLSIGALNKLRLVPYLKIDYQVGKYKLKRHIEIEGIISLIILILTSILTTLLPTPVGV